MYFAVTYNYVLPTTPTEFIQLQRTLPVKAYSANSAIEKAIKWIESTQVKLYHTGYEIISVQEVPSWEEFKKVIENNKPIKLEKGE